MNFMVKQVLSCCIALAGAAFGQGSFDGAGVYEIANIESNRVIDLDRNDRKTVIQFESRGTDNQRWEIRAAPNGNWYFINLMNGAALEQVMNTRSAPVEAKPFAASATQQWRIDRAVDGNAIILSHTGLALDIPDRSKRDGVRVQVYTFNGEGNQRFFFRRVSASGAVIDNRPSLRGPRGTPAPSSNPPGSTPTAAEARPATPDRSGKFFDADASMWKMNTDGVCLYQSAEFRGEAVCVRAGEDWMALRIPWNGPVSSLKLFGKAHDVDLFSEGEFRGKRVRISTDEADLKNHAQVQGGRIGSLRVF